MTLRKKLYIIIFRTDTKAGRMFDMVLIWIILASVITVILSSIPDPDSRLVLPFIILEWVFTIIFTIEYALRIYVSQKPLKYIFSFWGIIDLISFLPTYFTFFFIGYHFLLVVRILRLVRIFRVFKLARFLFESRIMIRALTESLYKIAIFIGFMLIIVILLGSLMYVIEGGQHGFNSIPHSIYWAIMTITTVGYGDIVPKSDLGKFLASFVMLIGYAIIAVPTGIVTAEFARSGRLSAPRICTNCKNQNPKGAFYCNLCGHKLENLPYTKEKMDTSDSEDNTL